MTTIRIGFKNHRDIEKMTLGELTAVRTALFTEIKRIEKLPQTTQTASLVSAMNKTMGKNINLIDRYAKALIDKALPIPNQELPNEPSTDKEVPVGQ